MRFNAVTIPPGATITNAYIQFQVGETNSVATSLTIQGEATDNATTFSSASGNISSRSRTASFVSWSPVPWTTVGEAGVDQRTPDIASIIQEIVNRPGWSSGNSLVIIVTGTGKRVAESFNGVPSAAPLLHVPYLVGSNTVPTVSISSPPDNSVFTEGDTITFTGTGTDTEDGDLTASLAWTSDLDGSIGSGGSFSTSTLSVGTHTITASVTDSGGLPGSGAITVTVNSGGGGTEVTFTPVADAYVKSRKPTKNYGSRPALEVDGSPTQITYLRFNVTGLSGAVQSARLRLEVTNRSSFGGTIYSISDTSWGEGTVTFDTRPVIDGPALDALGRVRVGDIVELDVTAAISGNGTYSFAMDSNHNNGADYRSREAGTNPPTLIITTN